MTYDNIIKKVDKYIGSDGGMPILVNLHNAQSLNSLKEHYNVGSTVVKDIGTYCQDDSLPKMAKLQNEMPKWNGVVCLYGIAPYLFLQGADCVRNTLRSLLDLPCCAKVIILIAGCENYLKSVDKRLFDAGRIVLEDGEQEELPTLSFIAENLKEPDRSLRGLGSLSRSSFLQEDGAENISVITNKKKSDFPNSLYEIVEYNSVYQVIRDSYPELSVINENVGTTELWCTLLQKLEESGSWQDFVCKKFGNTHNLSKAIMGFCNYDPFMRWAYFLALRTYGTGDNAYLSKVVQKSDTYDSFISLLFEGILDVKPSAKDFLKLYTERKDILSQLGDFPDKCNVFCKLLLGKGFEALRYLTDLTRQEKEMAIKLICQYSDVFDEHLLLSILSSVYPDLGKYLQPYNYLGNDFLNKYFRQYKYDKVTNRISPELREMVDNQAKEHEVLSWLQPRAVYVDQLPKAPGKCVVYFMDAMGAEYLAYLQQQCFANGLTMQADVARCELPSITSINKSFADEFKAANVHVYDNKLLDELKHEGQDSYNYENNKLPIHIVEELEILDKLVSQLKKMDADSTAYIIADHGASRLAVINESENRWEVSEKGLHSGRCCPKSDIEEKPEFAIEDNGFWSLANYDRFKGGRKALVEVHGGATIEEMTVPIITVTKSAKSLVCKLLNEKPVRASYKKEAVIRLFVEVDSDAIFIVVDGESFKAEKTSTQYEYEVKMPNIKKAGRYSFSVCNNGGIIAQGLSFEVKKEGASERKFF